MADEYRNVIGELMGLSGKPKKSNLGNSAASTEVNYINNLINNVIEEASVRKISTINSDSSEGKTEYSRLMNSKDIKILHKEGFMASYEDSDDTRKTKDNYWKIVLEYRETDYDKVLEGLDKMIKGEIITAGLAMSLIKQHFQVLYGRLDEIEKRFNKIDSKLKQIKKEK